MDPRDVSQSLHDIRAVGVRCVPIRALRMPVVDFFPAHSRLVIQLTGSNVSTMLMVALVASATVMVCQPSLSNWTEE